MAFDDDEGIWRERQSLTSKEGLTNTQRMVMRPVANGVAEVRTDERTFEELTIRLEEQSENVVLVIATSNRTGTPTASTGCPSACASRHVTALLCALSRENCIR